MTIGDFAAARVPAPGTPDPNYRPSIGALARTAQGGDRSAVDAFFRALPAFVRSSVLKHFSIECSPTLDDIVQDIVAKVFNALPRFDPSSRSDGAYVGWIKTVVLNHCRDRLRIPESKRPFTSDALPLDADGVGDVPDAMKTPDRLAMRGDHLPAARAVMSAIRALPPEKRAVLMMRLDGTPFADIALVLRIASGTLRWRDNTARNTLAEKAPALSCNLVYPERWGTVDS